MAMMKKRIPIAANENFSDAIITTAVMSLVGKEKTIRIKVIMNNENFSSNGGDEEEEMNVI